MPPAAIARVARIERAASARGFTAAAALGVLAIAVCLVTLMTGRSAISAAEIAAALAGEDGRAGFVVWQLRLPRLLLGALTGIAFGLSGALLQPALRNPLASPDILGISGGASAAACFAMLMLRADGPAASLAAAAGGLAVAGAIVLLSRAPAGGGQRGAESSRFLLIGVAFAFLTAAIIGYLVTRADENDAQQALVWTIGGLGRADWPTIGVLAACLAFLVPAAACCAPAVRLLTLGDELAHGLGVATGRARVITILVAVTLASVATAAAGPMSFVAFLSAPIARRLAGHGSIALMTSASLGVVIVLGAELVAGNLLPAQMPAGIVTAMIGGPALLWLVASKRAGRA